ncbi:MAG: ArnT family glycosyltransferase [Fimbriimonadales bacterium]
MPDETRRAAGPPQTPNSKRLIGLIILVTLVSLAPFATNHFISDDYDLVRDVSTGGPLAIWTFAPTTFFRPLISVSLWINYMACGWSSWGYLAPNFLLHAANTALVFLIARRFMEGTGSLVVSAPKQGVAAFAALVFMASPSHAEALFFMSCRTDLMAAFFGLLSVWVFLGALRSGKAATAVGAVILLLLGCLCKESVYALFLFFAGMAAVHRADRARSRVGWGAATGGFVTVAVTAIIRSKVVTAALPSGSPSLGVTSAAKAIARIGLMLVKPNVPLDAGILIRRSTPVFSTTDWAFFAVALITAGAATWFALGYASEETKRPDLRPPFIAFLAAALPVCFLAMPALSPEGGRLMYLPSAFAAICFAFLVAPLLQRASSRWVGTLWVAVAAGFTFASGVLYRAASDRCESSIAWMRSHQPPAKVAVIVVPDSIGGRYVWRNGFESALQSFAPEWARIPHVVVTYNGSVGPLAGQRRVDLRLADVSQVNPYDFQIRGDTTQNASLVLFPPEGEGTEADGVAVRWPAARR